VSFDTLGDINWLAVIAAAILWYGLGAFWYNRAGFGKQWMRSIGWDPEAAPPAMTEMSYIGPLVAYLIGSIAIAMIAVATGSDTFGEGLVLGLVIGIGISGALFYVTAVFDPTKKEQMTWFGVSAGYHLVGILIASVLVSVW
jgi:Protein of unknown function (DUF1761)